MRVAEGASRNWLGWAWHYRVYKNDHLGKREISDESGDMAPGTLLEGLCPQTLDQA